MPQNDDPYFRDTETYREPPNGWRATLRQVGPGLIIVGSVVGSGELIMTTKLGAVAGFALLWFVIVSCLIKVVIQTEIARHTISSGQTFLHVFNALPGPTCRRPTWLTLGWLTVVLLASVVGMILYVQVETQDVGLKSVLILAGVVLTLVGAAFTIAHRSARAAKRTIPSSPASTSTAQPTINWFTWLWLVIMLLNFVNAGAILGGSGQAVQLALPDVFGEGGDQAWSVVVAILAAVILFSGSYNALEKTLVTLVSTFTLLTVVSTILLQWTGYAITWEDVERGLSFDVPGSMTPAVIFTALAMYAGTGVAYGEMWGYTYWCVEKGYAKHTGAPTSGSEWPRRARGWIRVMYIDSLLTMVVYTASTVCFFLLGAAILYASGLDPDGSKTLATLGEMYTESLGSWAATLFVVGAFFVLFTTVVSGVASGSRVLADALTLVGVFRSTDFEVRMRFIRIFVVLSLALYLIAYWLFRNPPMMLIVTSSIIGAVMYPTLGLGVLYLRHRGIDPRIAPSLPTTVWLWICGLVVAIISPVGILYALAIQQGWISLGN